MGRDLAIDDEIARLFGQGFGNLRERSRAVEFVAGHQSHLGAAFEGETSDPIELRFVHPLGIGEMVFGKRCKHRFDHAGCLVTMRVDYGSNINRA